MLMKVNAMHTESIYKSNKHTYNLQKVLNIVVTVIIVDNPISDHYAYQITRETD